MPRVVPPLTPGKVSSAKPKATTYKLSDGLGLYLEVTPQGGRWWRFKYRVAGREKRISFGTYPEVSLAKAREERERARELVASGIDPSGVRKAKKAAKRAQQANSFEVIAREWHAAQSNAWVKEHADRVMLRLTNDVFPWLGDRPIAEVKRSEIRACIQRVQDRGAIESAHRVLHNIRAICTFAINSDRAESNPADGLAQILKPVRGSHHAALTKPAELGKLLRAIDAYEGTFVTRCALLLGALTFVRPGELRQAEWSEFDLDAAEWNIPAERMKLLKRFKTEQARDHLVPLSPPAVKLLRELHSVTGTGRWVFPSARGKTRPMSSGAVLAALRRMGYAPDEMTGHGWRAAARTLLDEQLKVRPDLIEAQLAHAVRDPNGRAYNRTSFLPERRRMMAKWAAFLDKLRKEKPVS
jgi:integrase